MSVILENTPLRADMDENQYVYPVLIEAFRHTSAVEFAPQLVNVLSGALADKRVQSNIQVNSDFRISLKLLLSFNSSFLHFFPVT